MRPLWKAQVAIFTLAGIALAVSIYIILAVKAHDTLYGCGGQDCGAVLEGRWERWGSFSVATLGVGGYLALMAGSAITAVTRLRGFHTAIWSLMAVEGIVGLGFIMWLICLQWLVIKHFCLFCLSSHLFGAMAYVLAVKEAPVWQRHRVMVGGSASAILAFMIAVHVLLVPDMMHVQASEDVEFADLGEEDSSSGVIRFGKPKEASRTVHLLDDALTFDLYKVPVLGPHDAEHVMLELSDYCCYSCRKLHFRMHQFREEYDLDIAIVHLPVPMNPKCNSNIKRAPKGFENACVYARYGMAVNKADSDKFEEYHNFMMQGRWPPSLKEARDQAESLVGRDEFEEALKDGAVDEWIATGVSVQRYTKSKTIPRLITKDQVISYSGGSKAGFARMLQKALGIQELVKRK